MITNNCQLFEACESLWQLRSGTHWAQLFSALSQRGPVQTRFKRNTDLLILQLDKGSGVVIMDHSTTTSARWREICLTHQSSWETNVKSIRPRRRTRLWSLHSRSSAAVSCPPQITSGCIQKDLSSHACTAPPKRTKTVSQRWIMSMIKTIYEPLSRCLQFHRCAPQCQHSLQGRIWSKILGGGGYTVFKNAHTTACKIQCIQRWVYIVSTCWRTRFISIFD